MVFVKPTDRPDCRMSQSLFCTSPRGQAHFPDLRESLPGYHTILESLSPSTVGRGLPGHLGGLHLGPTRVVPMDCLSKQECKGKATGQEDDSEGQGICVAGEMPQQHTPYCYLVFQVQHPQNHLVKLRTEMQKSWLANEMISTECKFVIFYCKYLGVLYPANVIVHILIATHSGGK